MSKMIQIRNVPERIHRILKARAAVAGRSLSDYLLEEITQFAERPTMEELLERISGHGSVTLSIPAAEIVREERDGR